MVYVKDILPTINLRFPFEKFESRTLLKKVSNLDFSPGVLAPVLKLLKSKFLDAPLKERITVLGLDEVEISDQYCYDSKEDQIYGGKNKLPCICARRLLNNWNQLCTTTSQKEFDL